MNPEPYSDMNDSESLVHPSKPMNDVEGVTDGDSMSCAFSIPMHASQLLINRTNRQIAVHSHNVSPDAS